MQNMCANHEQKYAHMKANAVKYHVCVLVARLLECQHVGAFDAVLAASYNLASFFGMKTQ